MDTKNNFLIILIASLLMLFAFPISALEIPVINDYAIKIVINDDYSYNVTETFVLDDGSNFVRKLENVINLELYNESYNQSGSISNVITDFESSIKKSKDGILIEAKENKDIYTVSYRYSINNSEKNTLLIGLTPTTYNNNINNITYDIKFPKPIDESEISFISSFGHLDSNLLAYNFDGTSVNGSYNSNLSDNYIISVFTFKDNYLTSQNKDGITFRLSINIPIIFIFISYMLWVILSKNKKTALNKRNTLIVTITSYIMVLVILVLGVYFPLTTSKNLTSIITATLIPLILSALIKIISNLKLKKVFKIILILLVTAISIIVCYFSSPVIFNENDYYTISYMISFFSVIIIMYFKNLTLKYNK